MIAQTYEGSKVYFAILSVIFLVLSTKLSVVMLGGILKRNYITSVNSSNLISVVIVINSIFALVVCMSEVPMLFVVMAITTFVLGLLTKLFEHIGDNDPSCLGRSEKWRFNFLKASLLCGVTAQVLIIFYLCRLFSWKVVIIAAGIYLLASFTTYLIKKNRTRNQSTKKSN